MQKLQIEGWKNLWPEAGKKADRRYCCYLLFSLKTHNAGFASDEEGDVPALSLTGALFMLAGTTIVVAIGSECAPTHLGGHFCGQAVKQSNGFLSPAIVRWAVKDRMACP